MTTHPAMILAAAEVFRGWGASVTVGEGPGHVRDTEMALVESGVGERARLGEAAVRRPQLSRGRLDQKRRPGQQARRASISRRPSLEADLIVSLPKMKTHHWVGVTAAMKNLYGVIPGIKYGWPKNVLHHNGIPETVFDINASLPKTIAIVDGIDCMEGDGPIMGTHEADGPGDRRHQSDRRRCHRLPPHGRRSVGRFPTCGWRPIASARSTSD